MIHLPDGVRENVEREQMVDRDLSLAKEFDRRLQARYPDMHCVFAGEKASYPGIVPGRWHVVQPGKGGAPDSYLPIVGPGGEYMELTEKVFEWLAQRDLHRPGALQALIDREHERLRLAEERKREMDAARLEEIVGRHKARVSPGVLFSPDVSWRYRKERS